MTAKFVPAYYCDQCEEWRTFDTPEAADKAAEKHTKATQHSTRTTTRRPL